MLINETRKNIYTRNNGDNVVTYYATKKALFPYVMVISGNDIYETIAITKVGVAIYKTIAMKRYHEGEISDDEEDIRKTMGAYRLGIDYDFKKYPDYFVVKQHDRAGLFKELMNKFRIGLPTLISKYGPVPDFDDTVQYGDVSIIPSPNMNKNSWALTKQTLDNLKVALSPYGFDHLVSGKFRVAKLSNRVAATYQYKSNITTLSLPQLRKAAGVQSLIHEMGHKWDDMSNLSKTINDKWVELLADGHSFSSSNDLSKGDTISFTAQKYKKYHGIVFTVVRVAYNGVISVTTEDSTGKIPPDMLLDGDPVDIEGNPIIATSDDPWFPTAYSYTNPSEFFAEIFRVWITGDVSDEVDAWLKSLPKP